jgi:hypothetical protein
MIGANDMRQIARFLRAVRHSPSTVLGDGDHEPEPPTSFAEIAAASSFLDFGGIPDGRWRNAWRLPGRGDFVPARQGTLASPRALPKPFENNSIGECTGRRINDLQPAPSEACCVRNSQPQAFPLSGRRSHRYVFSR